MRIKWKIFLALNFILGIPAFIFLMLLIVEFFNSFKDMTDLSIPFLFLFGFSVITFNSFLNIFILQRFFPDKLISPSVRTLNLVSFILNILLAVITLVLSIYATALEFGNDPERKITDGKVVLLIIFIGLIIHIIVLVMQGQLPALINRNNRERMNSMINSIGE